jgi:hypothetical protein
MLIVEGDVEVVNIGVPFRGVDGGEAEAVVSEEDADGLDPREVAAAGRVVVADEVGVDVEVGVGDDEVGVDVVDTWYVCRVRMCVLDFLGVSYSIRVA